MKSEYKEKWISALKSGSYSQSLYGLKTPEGFGVLGVLCDLVKNEVNISWVGPSPEFRGISNYSFGGEETCLPEAVRVLVGLNENNPIIEGSEISEIGEDGYSFEILAGWIEKYI